MGLGSEAMRNCQLVEALCYHVLLAAELSGWNQPIFVHDVNLILSMRFAARNRMLALMLKIKECIVLGVEMEKLRCAPLRGVAGLH